MTTRTPRQKRWVVRPGDGATVAEIVRKAGDTERALTEGRVFLGRRRVTSGALPVQSGDEVVIGPPPARGPSRAPTWSILWEWPGLVACVKPAGMPTVPDHAGAAHSLVALAATSLGKSVNDLFVTSRLDREVSGVVVFATSRGAEARLKEARARGAYERRYVAIAVDGASSPEPWNAPIGLGKDARHRAAFGPDAKESLTLWSAVACAGGFALLAVAPQTGRTHQIRVHASHAGAPLLGDRDYGGPARATLPGGRVVSLARIALHAARVSVPDEAGAPRVAEAPIPVELRGAWTDLGGASEAWDTAVTCALGS